MALLFCVLIIYFNFDFEALVLSFSSDFGPLFYLFYLKDY